MYKITVHFPDYSNTEYFTAIVPVVGDVVSIKGKYYSVEKRTLFSENPNFAIINVKPN